MQVTLEHTKRASVLLIRKLFLLMQNLGSLPSSVYLTMKLYYFDDCKKRCSTNVIVLNGTKILYNVLLLLQWPLRTMNLLDSRRESVTVCGLRELLFTLRLGRIEVVNYKKKNIRFKDWYAANAKAVFPNQGYGNCKNLAADPYQKWKWSI